nr:PD-(D/E)XK nuclease family transposase [Sporosarcina limicola]
MIKCSIYYWSGVYRTPIEKSMSYKELNPVIAINILNFDLLPQTYRFHTIARRLLAKGMDAEFVAESTDLDKERVLEIHAEML